MNLQLLYQSRPSMSKGKRIYLILPVVIVVIAASVLFLVPVTHADKAARENPVPEGVNITAYCPVIARWGGVTFPSWGNANDAVDYNTTTNPNGGRWGNRTNSGSGTYETVDLGAEYLLTGVGYSLDWDGAFTNSLKMQVAVSTDNANWTVVSEIIHPHMGGSSAQAINVDVPFATGITARYVRYWEPADGSWNGWGDYFHLRAFSQTPSTTCFPPTPPTPTNTPTPTATNTLTSTPTNTLTPTATNTLTSSPTPTLVGANITAYCPVIARTGGITMPEWGNANDAVDYNTTTNPNGGRWGNETNSIHGTTYETVDLGAEYLLTGVGYRLDWDGAFTNSLKMQVAVSTDNTNWTVVSEISHPHMGGSSAQTINVDIPFATGVTARYVRYWEPPDGSWNGWGDYFHLRAFSQTPSTTCTPPTPPTPTNTPTPTVTATMTPTETPTSDICAGVYDIPYAECNALVALYDSTNGPAWTHQDNWKASDTACNWYGVTCQNGHVVSLNLTDNSLYGALPPEIGNFNQLQALWLANNGLFGAIPPEIGNLTALRELLLTFNWLTGPIPPEIGNLSALEILDLDRNSLSGVIPTEIGNLNQLLVLELVHNQLHGEVPASITNLVNLQAIAVYYNALYSSDPAVRAFLDAHLLGWDTTQTVAVTDLQGYSTEPGSFTLLWTPVVYQEHGGFYEVRYATAPEGPFTIYQQVNKSSPGLTGTGLTPDTLYYFEVCTYTPAHDYQINELWSIPCATVAIQIAGAPTITPTSIPSATLTPSPTNTPTPTVTATMTPTETPTSDICAGVYDIPYAECNALVALYDSTNGPAWTHQDNWKASDTACNWYGVTCQNGHVVSLNLTDNGLYGVLPPEIGNFNQLQALWLANNGLFGAIPPEIGNLTALRELLLINNWLTDPIPPEIGNLSSVEFIGLGRNRLSGTLPAEIGTLTQLTALEFTYNQLQGEIPASITSLVNLQDMALSYNALYSSDPVVRAFLDAKSPDWAATQTIAVTDLNASTYGVDVITLFWTPIAYQADGGFYEIRYATAPEGPFTVLHQTTKNTSGIVAGGWTPGETYYFEVCTYTPAHDYQINELWSIPCATVAIQIAGAPTITPTSIPSATLTPSPTVTSTATLTPSATSTSTATATSTLTPSPTVTSTSTSSPTATSTATVTPSATATFTPSMTPTLEMSNAELETSGK